MTHLWLEPRFRRCKAVIAQLQCAIFRRVKIDCVSHSRISQFHRYTDHGWHTHVSSCVAGAMAGGGVRRAGAP
jgi:hypothetical protein